MDLNEIAAKLLKCNSVTGAENEVALYAKELFSTLGYDDAWIDKAGNVVGLIRGEGRHKILFDAHIDTVGLGDFSKWTSPPLEAAVWGGRMYARGASDMKGAFAAMIYAGARMITEGIKPAADIYISGTVNEETAEGRCIEVVLDDVKPDYVVIGEASEMNLKIGQRGRAEIVLTATGRSAHSSTPEIAVNAIERLTRAMAAVHDKVELASHPLLGKAIMVVTDIISQPYPGISVIPDKALCTYDRRLLPGESEEEVLAVIHSALAGMQDGSYPVKAAIAEETLTTYKGYSFQNRKFFPAWELPESDPYVTSAMGALQRAGIPAKISAYRFCTNGSSTAGVYGIPTVGFGPGTEKDAHTIDESISLTELADAAKGYQALMQLAL